MIFGAMPFNLTVSKRRQMLNSVISVVKYFSVSISVSFMHPFFLKLAFCLMLGLMFGMHCKLLLHSHC